jgi:tRNA G10  N-methylase Trm11
MELKYCYKLGHQPLLSFEEFKFLTKAENIQIESDHLLSDTFIDVQDTGGLIYGCEILKTWHKKIELISVEEACRFTKQYLINLKDQDQAIKKLGILLPESWKGRVLSSTKAAGVKKVNLLSSGQVLNYGHWKQTKNWLIFLELGDKTILGRILNYSDQEFWQNLDTDLPAGEMSRGLINLKLGRSLVNLASSQTIWDPFCGHGRLVLAGLDLKEEFHSSDIDAQVLIEDLAKNYDFAADYWRKYGFKQRPDHNQNLAKLHPVFDLDFAKLDTITDISKDILSKTSIVTEGYLGKNFKMPPNQNEMQQEWKNLEQLWKSAITQANKLAIPEIIFCLPFYQVRDRQFLPDFVASLIMGTDYKFADFEGKNYLLYSRKDSFTGHYIVKLSLKVK